MSDQQAYAGQADRTSGNDEWNRMNFAVRSIINQMATSTIVEVVAVGDRVVDVKPAVNQLDGAGNAIEHGTIHNVPVGRIQAGGFALVIDPVVGDFGTVMFCHSDISSAKANQGAANPGSLRRFDWSDAIYTGGLFGPVEPTQFIRVSGSGIELNAPVVTTSGGLSVGSGATTVATGRYRQAVDLCRRYLSVRGMTEPYDQIVAQLETVRTGPELSRLVASVRPSLDIVTTSIGQAQTVLAAAQELLTLDVSDLPKVVTFLGKLKTEVLGPYLAAYAKTLSAQAGNAAGIAQVTAAIAAAASRIGVPIP